MRERLRCPQTLTLPRGAKFSPCTKADDTVTHRSHFDSVFGNQILMAPRIRLKIEQPTQKLAQGIGLQLCRRVPDMARASSDV